MNEFGFSNVLDNLKFEDSLFSSIRSKENLERALVEFFVPFCFSDNLGHFFNGVVVSKGGYVVTAAHCVLDDLSGFYVRNYENEVFEIDCICRVCKSRDLALVKVGGIEDFDGYNLYNGEFKVGCEVSHLSRWAGELKNRRGKVFRRSADVCVSVDDVSCFYPDQVGTNAVCKIGDSGGVLMSAAGEFMGISSNILSDYYGICQKTYSTKAFAVVEFLREYMSDLGMSSSFVAKNI